MRKQLSFLLSVALLALGTGSASAVRAQSPYRACLIESQRVVMERSTLATDCVQGAKGVARPVVHERCEGLAQHAANGLAQRNPTRLTWLAQCPRGADAVCRGAYGGEVDVSHYWRKPGELDALAEQCETEGGHWKALH